MKGVILAAGKGSRLYPVTHHIPKPLLPLANRPTMHYAFDKLKEMNVTDICVVVGENEDVMKAELGDGSQFGIRLSYVRQTDPKGLAHAVGFAQNFVGDDSFVLYLGDAMYGGSFGGFAKHFIDSGAANLNMVKPVEDPRRFGVAELEGENIIRLVEKPTEPKSNLAMCGMYFFGPQIWSILPDLQPSGRGEYEITDAIQMMVDRGDKVIAGVYEDTWFDTGTLDSFLETSAWLVKGESLIGEGAVVNAEIGPNVVVGAGAVVDADRLEDCVIFPNAHIAVDGIIQHSILGKRVEKSCDIVDQILYED